MSSKNNRLRKPLFSKRTRPTGPMYVMVADQCRAVVGIDEMLGEVDRDVFDVLEFSQELGVVALDADTHVSYWFLEAPTRPMGICPTLSRKGFNLEDVVSYTHKAAVCWMRTDPLAIILLLKYMTFERDGIDAKWQYALLPKGTFAQLDAGLEPNATLDPEQALHSLNETFERIKAKSQEPVTFFHAENRPYKEVLDGLNEAHLLRLGPAA